MNYTPGDDVWVDFEENWWAGEIIKLETSGYVLCRVHFDDPAWDFGRSSARVMPEQVVAVRASHIRPRAEEPAND